ncbi:MAG: hypothetical protein AAGI23_14430 [Bacteroidota bacterium]
MNLAKQQWILPLIFLISYQFMNGQSIDIQTIDGQTKTIAPKETHLYHLTIRKDEFAFMRFEQQGTDIGIRVKDPDGELLMQFDTDNGKQGPELVHVIPNQDGVYQIEVQPLEEQKRKGNYTFHFDEKIKKADTYA